MNIQTLLYPQADICGIEEMYFRRSGCVLSLETYFNAFSIGKWRKYTIIDNLSLYIQTPHCVSFRCFNAIGETLPGCNDISDVQQLVDVSPFIRTTRRELPVEVISCMGEDALFRSDVAGHSDNSCPGDSELYGNASYDADNSEFPDNASCHGDSEFCGNASCHNGYRLHFPKLPEDGIIYIEITFPFDISNCALDSLISGGFYETCAEAPLSPVLALGICTFKREEFLKRNVNSVIANILDNPASPLYGKLEVYISDNAGTLSEDIFFTHSVHLFTNPNTGGAGGFTRTMLEAIVYNGSNSCSADTDSDDGANNKQYTHMLLMDDDIILDTNVLERTYFLLSYLKKEYRQCMLGASMFDINRQYLQIEAGARLDGFDYTFYHKFFDMRKADFVSANEADTDASYSGWWYCCIPASIIRRDNLPLPMFLHFDDVEYGMRTHSAPILINGICVWHPPAVSKGAAAVEYYDIRNCLILQSAQNLTPSAFRKMLFSTIIRISFLTVGELVRYRYSIADARLMGYEDFHRGPEHFMQTDPAENHAALSAFNYRYLSPTEAGIPEDRIKALTASSGTADRIDSAVSNKEDKDNDTADGFKAAPARSLKSYLLSALCWLLPPFGGTRVCSSDSAWLPFFARRVYVYSPALNSGYIVKRSYRQFARGLAHYIRTLFHIIKDYKRDMRLWHSHIEYMTSLEFWKEYEAIKKIPDN